MKAIAYDGGVGVMRSILVLAVLLAHGCFSPASITCSDGTLCPASTVCAPSGGSCVTPDQITACDGRVDGEDCDIAAGNGKCEAGVCVFVGCGDGERGPGELCDDGNTTSGDGCRADCKKEEVCGDGITDANEACDDDNANPSDGCDACVANHWPSAAIVGGNVLGSSVALRLPASVAVDQDGNVFIADTGQHRIRRVDAKTQVATIVAGTGVAGFSGDSGAASNARLNAPRGIALDGFGTLFIADTQNHRVRRVDALTGVITTVAGTGTSGFSNDGMAATSAQLNVPSDVAIDGSGTVYIADSQNSRIRSVDETGIITTVAGNGTSGGAGDGGLAVDAQLDDPSGLAVDVARNLFIADTSNHRIRRVDATTKRITTIVGTGAPGFNGDGILPTSALLNRPSSVSLDGSELVIADTNNQRIRRATATTISTIIGTGTPGSSDDNTPATMAQLRNPADAVVDRFGNTYVADELNHRVRRISLGVIQTTAGTRDIGYTGDNGAATSATLLSVSAVAVHDDGLGSITVYVADRNAHRIRRIDNTGLITTVAGTGSSGNSGDNGAAIDAQLAGPEGVAVDVAGNLYIADTNNHRIRVVDASTNTITNFAGTGVFGFTGDNGTATAAQLNNPRGVAVDTSGNVYIADSGNHRVRRVTGGTISTIAGSATAGFSGDGGIATLARLNLPSSVAFDSSTNTLYIADTSNHRIRFVVGTTIDTVAGTGPTELFNPDGIALATGSVFIADRGNHRVRRVTAGVMTTIAGTGTAGDTGDGGTATGAALNAPEAVAVDSSNNIYVADTANGKVRRITGTKITSFAGQIDAQGMGPQPTGRLADPQALTMTPQITLVAGGSNGTIQVLTTERIAVVAGLYPQPATADLARFRGPSFGTVSGVAFDGTGPAVAAGDTIFITESNTHGIHTITVVDPGDPTTWRIERRNPLGAGSQGTTLATAQFRSPTGLYFDAASRQLYVADTGNHVVRKIDLSGAVMNAPVTTIAGQTENRGFFDGDATTQALLFQPRAVVRCNNGDIFIADTGNNRVRRVDAASKITTVLGDGIAASSGEGSPAKLFSVDAPLGLACDDLGNVFTTSHNTLRLLPANDMGVVDGSGPVQTIYGALPRDDFPASVTRCLTGVAVVDVTTVRLTDACTGLLVQLVRQSL